eukprot:Gb_31605 [translate_table: standard]
MMRDVVVLVAIVSSMVDVGAKNDFANPLSVDPIEGALSGLEEVSIEISSEILIKGFGGELGTLGPKQCNGVFCGTRNVGLDIPVVVVGEIDKDSPHCIEVQVINIRVEMDDLSPIVGVIKERDMPESLELTGKEETLEDSPKSLLITIKPLALPTTSSELATIRNRYPPTLGVLHVTSSSHFFFHWSRFLWFLLNLLLPIHIFHSFLP